MRGAVTAPGASPRRGIEPYHLVYAAARRPRVSWQELGRQLGVNAQDLQRAMERGIGREVARPEPAPPRSVPRRSAKPYQPKSYASTVQAGTKEARVLAVVCERPIGCPLELADATGLLPGQVRSLVQTLRAKGFVVGAVRQGGWRATAEGLRMQDELDAEAGRG